MSWSAFGSPAPGCVLAAGIPGMVEQYLVAAARAPVTVLKDRAELSMQVPYTRISSTLREGVYAMCRRHIADEQQHCLRRRSLAVAGLVYYLVTLTCIM